MKRHLCRWLEIVVAATLLAALVLAVAPAAPARAADADNPITDVSINGGGNTAIVTAGASFSISLNYYIAVSTGCPSCIKQIEIGWSHAATPVTCAYDGQPGVAGVYGSWSGTLTAPSTPGLYYVAYGHALRFDCDPSANWWSTPIPIATIIVNPVCLSTASGDWNTAATWSCGHVPSATENAVVQGHAVTLSNNAAVKDLVIAGAGSVEINGKTLALLGDLVDNSSADKPVKDTPGTGKVSLEGHSLQKIRSGNAKSQETKIDVQVELTQQVKLEKDARFHKDVKVNPNGKLDVYSKIATLEKDLIDNANAGAEAEVLGSILLN